MQESSRLKLRKLKKDEEGYIELGITSPSNPPASSGGFPSTPQREAFKGDTEGYSKELSRNMAETSKELTIATKEVSNRLLEVLLILVNLFKMLLLGCKWVIFGLSRALLWVFKPKRKKAEAK